MGMYDSRRKPDEAKKNLDELKKQLKENKIGKLYLFTGPERYLIRYYEKEIVKRLLDEKTKTFNHTVFEGKVSMNELSDTLSMYPVFSERRIAVVRESTLLKAGAKEQDWGSLFEALPDYICLIFIQREVDKRISFYKALKKYGLVAECSQQDEAALAKWMRKVFASSQKQITDTDAAYFVNLLEPDMSLILTEIEKVISFMGDKPQVTRKMIQTVVSKSVKARIFDLTDAVSQHKMAQAIQITNDLIELKEPIPMIMAMLGRQLSLLMKTKRMEQKKMSVAEMAKVLGVPPFIVGKIQKQASSFGTDMLKKCIHRCMETDLAVKTGRMNDRIALDLFLVEMQG